MKKRILALLALLALLMLLALLLLLPGCTGQKAIPKERELPFPWATGRDAIPEGVDLPLYELFGDAYILETRGVTSTELLGWRHRSQNDLEFMLLYQRKNAYDYVWYNFQDNGFEEEAPKWSDLTGFYYPTPRPPFRNMTEQEMNVVVWASVVSKTEGQVGYFDALACCNTGRAELDLPCPDNCQPGDPQHGYILRQWIVYTDYELEILRSLDAGPQAGERIHVVRIGGTAPEGWSYNFAKYVDGELAVDNGPDYDVGDTAFFFLGAEHSSPEYCIPDMLAGKRLLLPYDEYSTIDADGKLTVASADWLPEELRGGRAAGEPATVDAGALWEVFAAAELDGFPQHATLRWKLDVASSLEFERAMAAEDEETESNLNIPSGQRVTILIPEWGSPSFSYLMTYPIIVYGRVTDKSEPIEDIRAEPFPYVYREVTVEVIDCLRGDVGETVTYREQGGETKNLRFIVEGYPTIAVGRNIILFLQKEDALISPSTLWKERGGAFSILSERLPEAFASDELYTRMETDDVLQMLRDNLEEVSP